MSDDPEATQRPAPMSRAELLGVFAFWTMLAVLTAANRLVDTREPALSIVSRSVPVALAFQQMYTWALLTPFVFWLAGRFSIDKSNAAPRLALLLAIGVVVAFLVDRLNSSLVAAFHVQPGFPAAQQGGIGAGPGSGGFFSILHGPMVLNHFIIYIGVLSAGFARDYFCVTALVSARPRAFKARPHSFRRSSRRRSLPRSTRSSIRIFSSTR